MVSTKGSVRHKIIYLAGLLTDDQIDIFKRGKKFDHFIAPYLKKDELLDEMNRPVSEAFFLRKYDNNGNKDDLIKRVKLLFCSGNKSFR